MAVSENDLVVGPLTPAAGVTTISLDFFFEQATWLDVYKSGSETPLVLSTDYTVAGAGTGSGVVTLTTPANGIDDYSVYLIVPLQRSSDMQLRGQFKSEPFNLELDRVWQAMQGLKTAVSRSLSIKRSSTAQTPTVPDPDTGKALAWGDDGNLVNSALDLDAAQAIATRFDDLDSAVVQAEASASEAALYDGPRVDDVATLLADTALTLTTGQPGTVAVGDFVQTREELFAYQVATAAATDHDLATAGGIKAHAIPKGEYFDVRQFGDWDASTDVGVNLQGIFDKVSAMLDAGDGREVAKIRVPGGSWPIITEARIYDPRLSLVGQGSRNTFLAKTGSGRALHYRPASFSAGAAGFSGGVDGMTITGTTEANQTLCEYGDAVGIHFRDFAVSRARGTGSVGLWGRNVNGWTERTSMDFVHCNYCTKGHQISAASGSDPGTDSFGYSRYNNIFFNADNGQVAWHLDETAPYFYNSKVNSSGNIHGTNSATTYIKMGAGARISRCFGSILGENNEGPGASGIVQEDTSRFQFYGDVILGVLKNSNANAVTKSPTYQVINGTGYGANNTPHFTGTGTRDVGGVSCDITFSGIDKTENPYAVFGFQSGANRASPFIGMYNTAGNEATFLAVPFGAAHSAAVRVAAVTKDGDFETDGLINFKSGTAQGGDTIERKTIASGASATTDIRPRGGIIMLRDITSGGSAAYLVDEMSSFVSLLAGHAKFVAGAAAPGSGKIGLECTNTATTISNGTASSKNIHVKISAVAWV